MRTEEDVDIQIEELKKTILAPKTNTKIRESCVNMLRALEWVKEDSQSKMEQRLKDVGITKSTRKETET